MGSFEKGIKKIVLLILFLAISLVNVEARVSSVINSEYTKSEFKIDEERLCVKYRTQDGWSDGYQVKVQTMKGSDLNKATS